MSRDINDSAPLNPFLDPEETPLNSSLNSHAPSAAPSRPGTPTGPGAESRGGRVRFGNGEAVDHLNNRFQVALRDANSPLEEQRLGLEPSRSPFEDSNETPDSEAPTLTGPQSPPEIVSSPEESPRSETSAPELEIQMPQPNRPAPLRLPEHRVYSYTEQDEENEKSFGTHGEPSLPSHIPRYGGSASMPGSTTTSPMLQGQNGDRHIRIDDIPLLNVGSSALDIGAEGLTHRVPDAEDVPKVKTGTQEAHNLVRQHTRRGGIFGGRLKVKRSTSPTAPPSRAPTPSQEKFGDYVEKPEAFKGGVLGSLLSLYAPDASGEGGYDHKRSASGTFSTGTQSGRSTPKWYRNNPSSTSTTSLGGLLAASGQALIAPAAGNAAKLADRPKVKHRPYSYGSPGFKEKLGMKPKAHSLENEIKITIHIADVIARQRYILKICRCLMLYGAPTHRLEEALKMTSRVLQIDGQFLYIPGCMLISFGDPSTHTSEMHIVRTNQGVDLSKLEEVHTVYKEVVHDCISVEEATQRLDEIMRRRPLYGPWMLVPVFGLASAAVGPFGFQARPLDMPILFILGCLLGVLQLIVTPNSSLYANVFEISAAVLTSFLARAFGSIRDGDLFCFSALAQASIALILPGYLILCGSLELQSKSIVAGSVRMFYAIIYSLFLGFGITIGSALYALMDSDANSATTCPRPLPWKYNFIFVGPFAVCLAVINQARWRQLPLMVFIALAGYVVNFFSSQRFPSQPEIATGLGAFTIGVLGNLYSRIGHGLAFAAMLPGIFVLVPGGLAAQGGLMTGINNANALAGNQTATNDDNGVVFEFGYNMIQIAIGITVGLFMAALVVYPVGKRRSSLFSF